MERAEALEIFPLVESYYRRPVKFLDQLSRSKTNHPFMVSLTRYNNYFLQGFIPCIGKNTQEPLLQPIFCLFKFVLSKSSESSFALERFFCTKKPQRINPLSKPAHGVQAWGNNIINFICSHTLYF